MIKVKKLKIISVIAVLFAMLGLCFVISADEEPGRIKLTKEATKVKENFDDKNLEYGRKANITLKVSATPYTEQEMITDKLDIILVLDSSGSMAWTPDGKETNNDSKKRITALKTSAKDFINGMIDDTDNVRIGIVDYASNVKSTRGLTSNKSNLISTLNTLNADGGTNTQAAIIKTDELLDNSRSEAKKLVIILTDGIPTYFNYGVNICGNGREDKASNKIECPRNIIPSDAAKTALDTLKKNHNTTDVYTITFGNESAAAQKLEKINPKSADGISPVRKNITALTAEDLKKEFQHFQDAVKNIIGKDSSVVDIIPREFKLTEEAKKELELKEIKFVENSDGTTTIEWNIGNIEAGKDNTLSFDVVACDEYHGSMYTNVATDYKSAMLKTTVDDSNPYYKNESNKDLTLYFDAPVVDIPAITNDDHYSKNSSYVGVTGSTIRGTTILENDLDKNVYFDKEKEKTNINVLDNIIIDENENTIKIDNNKYQLKENGKLLGTLTMNTDGTFNFVSECDVVGEVKFNYHIKTTVTRDNKNAYVYSNSSTVTLNVIERKKVNIEGLKTWVDNNNQDGIRPDSVTVILKANGEEVSRRIVDESSNWKYEFRDLDKYELSHEDDENHIIKYTVEEINIANGYKVSYDGINITNTHEVEKTTVSGVKTWVDNNNQDGIRPDSITVILRANGKEVSRKIVDESSNWKYEFTDLDKYKDGKKIVYTITETEVEGYISTLSGTNITNTHEVEKTTVSGEKIWVDNNNQDGIRPDSIIVILKANGKEVSRKSVSSLDNWTYKFTNLDKYSSGREIAYTVEEINIKDGYEVSYDNNNIINTHSPRTKNIDVTKVWEDNDNNDGIRSSMIEVTLTGKVGEEVVEIIKTTIDNTTNWIHTFNNLPEYYDGNIISYYLDETPIDGYSANITTNENGNFIITNTHELEKVTINGTKNWDDNNNQDGKRPNSITIKLLADNELIMTKDVVADEDGNWKYEFTNLDKYKNGKEIIYTLEEVTVEGYEAKIDGNSYDITNYHEPEMLTYTVNKKWLDNEDNDAIRPDSINVSILANGVIIEKAILTKDNNWTYTFKNLPRYSNGSIIEYTLIEDEVKGYIPNYEYGNYDEDNKTITSEIINNHDNEKLGNIIINKYWDDLNNPLRPNSIKVIVYANGEEFKIIEITKDNNWTYILSNLDKYKDGKIINYTIKEIEVDGYTSTINGFDIVNSLIYGKGGDVEELPPQTGINIDITKNNKGNISVIAMLISLLSLVLVLRKNY